jgi:hypothetical protein
MEMKASSPDFESDSKVNVADSVAVPVGSTEPPAHLDYLVHPSPA